MRYSEKPEISVEVLVDVPPESLWPLVTDLDLPARFSDEFQGATWAPGVDGAGLGAVFLGRNRHPAIGEWEVACTVIDFEINRRFGWAVGTVDDPAACWRFEIDPQGEGSVLRQWAQMGPGPSGLTPMIERDPDGEEALVEMRLTMWRGNMEATVAGIKALAEAIRT